MTITFADGTRMEVAASAYNDFIAHDLKWVEFVHGRATVKKMSCKTANPQTLPQSGALSQNAHRCPSLPGRQLLTKRWH
jgi:hypothetical protein